MCYVCVRWGGGATWAHSRIARPGRWGVGHCGPMLTSANEGGNGGCKVRGQLTLEKSGEEEVGGGGDLPRDAVAERVFRALLRRVIILLITAERQPRADGVVYTSPNLGEGV